MILALLDKTDELIAVPITFVTNFDPPSVSVFPITILLIAIH